MTVLKTIAALRTWRRSGEEGGGRVVLVPTMGALHEGHLTLMREARRLAGERGRVVVSVFVNPTQFGPNEDFAKYPRELEEDAAKCRAERVDAVFAPEADEVYAGDRSLQVLETKLSKRLCGASRPGHFDGVCLVVLKLFNLVQPEVAVFGKKDYQQLAIIHRMVRDLNVPVELAGVETVREADGLALSSRNRYLDGEERLQAAEIRRGLLLLQARFLAGETNAAGLVALFREHLQTRAPRHRVDYIECVQRESLEAVAVADEQSLLATAVFFGKTRLIDNLELGS